MVTQSKTTIHVVQHLAPGGLESLALDMLAFSNANQRVLIVSLEGSKDTALSNWPKLTQYQDQLIFLDKPQGRSVETLIKLVKLFRILKPQSVHTHHIGPMIYGSVAARLAGVKSRIHTEHDAWHLNARKHRFLQGIALYLARPRVVADAQLVSDQLTRHFDYRDVTVIKNGIDCERFKPGSKHLARQALNIPLNQKIIGAAGRLEKVKGHDVLINAMTRLENNVHLVIAGCGSQKAQLETQARALGIAHRVTLLGLIDDMPRFYQSLDVFCLPSRSEGFPLSTLEAQACGIQTVATNVGATGETLDPATGTLVTAEDHHQMAMGLEHALETTSPSSPRSFVLDHNEIRKMVEAYTQLAQEKRA
ncbi:glycosyltransferase [Vibrio sinaloensis DSM 21326]|uniref:Glycosyltransferase n=1 Tax=Vibrio sinaloensis DSM 21326 TaxID=945550 RepID=E8MA18_PHOS4|nr:glycosyltransferase [Vibrio sinaloensis]EGA69135.1 glycosyltransferase [Vibrio sinaloensis DSM 21326]